MSVDRWWCYVEGVIDVELLRRCEAVRMPLDLAAKDNFAGVRKIVGLGIALRAACDGLIAKAEPNEALVAWRARLGEWEQLTEDQRAVEVARGMRLMTRYPTRQRAAVKSTSEDHGSERVLFKRIRTGKNTTHVRRTREAF